MDEKKRTEYLRKMQEGMRAITDEEISARGDAGMRNFWCTNEAHWIPETPKPNFWQRLKRLFVTHNAE